jgi:hypothetical protein
VEGLLDLVNEMKNQHVHFKTLTDSIDTKTPVDRFFFHVMASLAQMEQELIVERTRAVAGSPDRTLRVWDLQSAKGGYYLHPARSYLQLCLRSGRANEYCRRRVRPSEFPAARRSKPKNTE